MIIHLLKSDKKTDIVMPDASVIQIDHEFGLIWIHPSGTPEPGSFRLNLRLKMVDVLVGHDGKPKLSNDVNV